MKLIPKHWEKFQHYKDRNPPWIKLHKDLLDDYDWWSLPVASRALAPCLWLLASCYEEGIFDADYDRLAFRFRMTEKEVETAIKPLIDKGYFIIASDALADGKQGAMPEERREEKNIELQLLLDSGIDATLAKDFLKIRKAKKAPLSESALKGILKECDKAGISLAAALEICCQRGWQGFNASWLDESQKPKRNGVVL